MSCFVVIVYINQFSIRTSNYYNALKSIMKEREGATVKVLVIHNIGSGHGAGAIYDFIRSYAEDGDTITLRTFNGHTPFATLLEDARDYDFVVASGGDGTIAAVTYELRYSDIPILPFPSGTANLLAMNLSSPNEPHALCKVADQGQTMYFDLGEIETPEASIGFTIMAGCGYDEIIMRLATQHKQVLGPVAYFHAAFTNPTPPHSQFMLNIDGQRIESDGIAVVFTNFSRIQFDLMVSDMNLPQDGLIDVVIVKTKTALELLPTLVAKAVDHSGNLVKKIGSLEVYRGREITIEATPEMYMEYDGEPTRLHTPFTVRCLPRAARYIVSDDCIRYFEELRTTAKPA